MQVYGLALRNLSAWEGLFQGQMSVLHNGHSFGSFLNETSTAPYPDAADGYSGTVPHLWGRITDKCGVEEPLSER